MSGRAWLQFPNGEGSSCMEPNIISHNKGLLGAHVRNENIREEVIFLDFIPYRTRGNIKYLTTV